MIQQNEDGISAQKLLFVDAGVSDTKELLTDLQPGFKVILLTSKSDAISQISTVLTKYAPVSGITILSHAEPGIICFSNQLLDIKTLNNRASEVINWSDSLTTDAKICIYGCSLALGEIGQEFIHTLKNLVGAEIASSSLPIGKVGSSHNWSLDRFTKSFEVLMPFHKDSMANYVHRLEPVISINRAASILEINEGTVGAFRQIEFVVTLSEPATATTDISYRTLDGTGTATGGVDFVEEVSFVRIQAGQSSTTFNISVFPDMADETDESVVVELFNPTNAVFADGAETLRSTGVILDDDGTTNDRALFVSQVQVVEGNDGSQQAVFEVQLSRSSTSSITLNYATADGSAKESQDYQAQNGTVNFAPGETLKTVTVPLLGDAVAEANEFFNLVVTPTSATNNGVDGAVGTAVILDDDTSASLPEISISGSSALEGTVGAFRQIEFVVTLSEPAIATTDISYRTLDGTGTATGGVDFVEEVSFVRIQAGQSSTTFNISVFPDTADETDESVVVELFNPTNAVFPDGVNTLQATGIILDDDGTGNNLGLFVENAQIVEGEKGFTREVAVPIHLSRPSDQTLTFQYQTADGSAQAGDDYTSQQSGTVTFLPGQTLAAAFVSIIGDDVTENDETFTLTVTPTVAIANGSDGATGTVTIIDGDVPDPDADINEIIGTPGRDILTGTAANDVIKSLGGNIDRMTGGEGGDIFVFGAETTNGIRERDIILDYEVGIDAIQLEDGAIVGSVRQTSSGVTVFFEGDRDAVYVQGQGVLVGNLTFIPEVIV